MTLSILRRDFIKSSAAILCGSILPTHSMKKIAPKAGEIILGHGSFRYKVIPNWGILDAGKIPSTTAMKWWKMPKGD